MMARYSSLFLFFFILWAVMLIIAFFVSWSRCPDLLVIGLVYAYFFNPDAPVWRALLPVSLLCDFAGHVPLGMHGVWYALAALVTFPLWRYWTVASTFERLAGIIGFCTLFQVVKCISMYIVLGIPAPNMWYLTIVWQLLALPFVRYACLHLSERHLRGRTSA